MEVIEDVCTIMTLEIPYSDLQDREDEDMSGGGSEDMNQENWLQIGWSLKTWWISMKLY